jgi:hypothetical protein
MHGQPVLIRWDATFPSLVELRRRGWSCSPIAWATAQLTAVFVKYFPRDLPGVLVPEALPAAIHRQILGAVRSRGIYLTKRVIRLKMAEETAEP